MLRGLQVCKTLKNVLDVKSLFIQLKATRCFMLLKLKHLSISLSAMNTFRLDNRRGLFYI